MEYDEMSNDLMSKGKQKKEADEGWWCDPVVRIIFGVAAIILILWNLITLYGYLRNPTDADQCYALSQWTSLALILIALVAFLLPFRHRYRLDWVGGVIIALTGLWVFNSVILILGKRREPASPFFYCSAA